MSRHSKWSKVKQFKGAIDAKRSASFTKLAREITIAAKEKGSDPAMNARLRAAIARAREGSMPKDNIERAITRGAGGGTEGQLETLNYEAYAPGGTALIIQCITDNRNRTANTVKHLLSKNNASLASSGSVTYLFDYLGVVRTHGGFPEERRESIELALIDAGSTNIMEQDNGIEIQCQPNDLSRVADVVAKHGLDIESVEFEWMSKTLVETDQETGMHVAELMEQFEADDDVSRVFSNLA